jgi:hypothetical protein
MKQVRSLQIIFAVLTLGAVLFSCEKELKIYLPEQTDLSNKSFVKVYNATLNATRNYVYFDNVPVTGAGLAYGGLFPSVSYYSAIDPGNRAVTIKDTLVTTTQKPVTFSSQFDAGSNYTIFTYDTLNNTKYLVTKDALENPTDTTARLRFANLIFSRVAVPNVDIFSVKRQANIFTNVAPATVTNFIPFASAMADTLFVRATGTTTNLTQLNAISPTQKRSYTVVFRGVYQLTTGTNTRVLASFTNY